MPEENKRRATIIYNEYIEDGSPNEINISADMKATIRTHMEGTNLTSLTRECTEANLDILSAMQTTSISTIKEQKVKRNSVSDTKRFSISVRSAHFDGTGNRDTHSKSPRERSVSKSILPSHVFDEAYHEVWTLMENDHFLRFQFQKLQRNKSLYARVRSSVVGPSS